jgi:hypothetical protein
MIEKTGGGMVRTWVGCWRWRGQVAKKQWHRDLQGNHHPQGSPEPLMVQDLGEDGAVRFTAMHSTAASQRCMAPPPLLNPSWQANVLGAQPSNPMIHVAT